MSFQNKMASTLNNLDVQVYDFFRKIPFNDSLEGIVLAVIILYSSTFALQLPKEVVAFMASTPATIAALAFVLTLSNRKPTISLALAVGIFATLNAAQHRGFWEHFDTRNDAVAYKSPERIVPGPAFKDAMFKTRHRIRLEKAAGISKDDNLFQTAPYGFDIAM